jgi:hypothetical protein
MTTRLSIDGERFLLNGTPTHAGCHFRGRSIAGMLFISRMANATVDDHNPATAGVWAYADGPWSAERNTRDFIAALPTYRRHGLDAVGINLMGGSPQGYSWLQPWHLSGFADDGAPRPGTFARAEAVIRAADALGMVVNLGIYYGWAAAYLRDEAAALRVARETCDWLAGLGAGNVLLEIGNEIDNASYTHDVLKPARCAEMFALVRARCPGVPVSTSFNGGIVPPDQAIALSDYVLLHGNNVEAPDGIRRQVAATRASAAYRGQPLLYNEDDHYDFDKADNNFIAAVECGAGWGFFDFRRTREKFADGYQSLPVDWGITAPRKRGFFTLLAEITGAERPA